MRGDAGLGLGLARVGLPLGLPPALALGLMALAHQQAA
jgi:hypothetical protein